MVSHLLVTLYPPQKYLELDANLYRLFIFRQPRRVCSVLITCIVNRYISYIQKTNSSCTNYNKYYVMKAELAQIEN